MRGYLTAFHERVKARSHKEKCRAANVCICGPVHGGPSRNGVQHGPVVRGGKCARCIDVHSKPKFKRD